MRERGTPRQGREHGAALVEFAVLTPMLLLLVLGMVEFGWLFGQFNDVRHGAREGARYAAVNGGDENTIADRVCQSMDGLDAGMTQIVIAVNEVESNGTAGIQRGDTGTLQVTADVSGLSNVPLISVFLPNQLSSTVEFRMEQDPDLWAPATITKTTCP